MGFSVQCKNVFWLENVFELFCNVQIIPTLSMSLESQFNALTRLFIIISVLLFIVTGFQTSFTFLIFSILFIIILYYIQKKMANNQTENYEHPSMMWKNNITSSPPSYDSNHIQTAQANHINKMMLPVEWANTNCYSNNSTSNVNKDFSYLCNEYSLDYLSKQNQKLIGKPHPKTFITPIIAPRAFDSDVWRDNEFVHPHGINRKKQHYEYESGYKSCEEPINIKSVRFEFPYEINDNCDDVYNREYNSKNNKHDQYDFYSNKREHAISRSNKHDSHYKQVDTLNFRQYDMANFESLNTQADLQSKNFVGMPDISRSNLDFAKNSNLYNHFINENEYEPANMREFAEKSFLYHQLEHRNNISESLMYKKNIEASIRNKYPMRRF